MRVGAHTAVLLLAILLAAPAFGQQSAPVVQGAFTASAGPAVYRGKWSARISSRTPNAAAGSWILVNNSGEIVLQGTWSARKSGTKWQGTWSARVLRGPAYSGTWTASEPGLNSKTFAEMLQAATKAGAAGTWRSGRFGGNWRLAPNL